MSKWIIKRLDKVLKFYNGKICKTASNEIYPVYGSNGKIGFAGEYNFENAIIIGRVGAYCGSININTSKFWASDNTIVAKSKPNSSIIYLNYMLQTMKLNNYAGGSAQPLLNQRILKNLKIQIPDLKTQEKIADLLSTYDELIENNNRRIEILEKTAEEIYKEWFVRMRFPGHGKIKFIKGIPEGWEVKRVGDLANIKSGYAFKSKWWREEGIPVIKIKDIQNNTLDLNGFSYVSEENAEKSKNFYVNAGDLLIAMTGATIGKIALVPYYDLMTVNQRVGKFFLGDKPQEKVAFLFCLFSQKNIREQIVIIGNSNAAQPNISPFEIEKIKILYNESVVNLFNKKIKPCISLILKLQKQNQNLIKQRDLLLPRLMNGTIKVK